MGDRECMVHLMKEPQLYSGRHLRIACLCNIKIIFYFLVNIFISLFYV